MTRSGLPVLLVLLAATAASAAPRNWWDRDWSHRKRVVLAGKQTWESAPSAHIRIATGGRAKPDGSDIRVIAGGREVPRGIMARGPGDLFEVAFPVGRETGWDIYYGNPDAEKPPKQFEPDRGLILETRARGPGNPTNWEGMQKILAASPRVFGGSYWPRIFDAENPFGPSDDYVSIYRGFINIHKPGAYTFFTASDEASFLLVGDKLVAQWPGWHDAKRGAWGTFKGRIQLEAGLHPFRYVHVERKGAQVMAAYYQPPGEKKGRVIPHTAFPGLRRAQVVSHEVHGKDVAADFSAVVESKWGLDNRVYVGMAMKALLAGPEAEYRWDFGDGSRAEGPIVHHVYLRGGSYDVALTVAEGGDRDTMIRTIHVTDQWTRFDRNREEVRSRFARIVSTYPGDRLSPEAIERLAFLLEDAGRIDELAEILRAALERGKLLRNRPLHLMAMRLGEYCRDNVRDLDGAVWAFQRAASVSDPKLRLTAQVAVAEALVLLGGDAATALRLLVKAIESPLAKEGDLPRLAHLRAGDACMILGDGQGARDHYRIALEHAGGAENSKRILRKAGAMRTAMTLLETGEMIPRLQKSLRAWEWHEPTERFAGLHRIARARALILLESPGLATRELEALLAGNPESEYADQALALLAEIAREAGRTEDAERHMERLRKQYPWSPLAR